MPHTEPENCYFPLLSSKNETILGRNLLFGIKSFALAEACGLTNALIWSVESWRNTVARQAKPRAQHLSNF